MANNRFQRGLNDSRNKHSASDRGKRMAESASTSLTASWIWQAESKAASCTGAERKQLRRRSRKQNYGDGQAWFQLKRGLSPKWFSLSAP
eukprot:6163721-Amphidinium_carterae.1